jgi:signal transduction histidine kinase/tetratricopeptide (TPR) repeat protein
MEIFALNDEVSQLETALLTAQGVARLSILIPLAWHVRQRNSLRALALADEAKGLLSRLPDQRQSLARLQLVWAEIKWLTGELDAAEAIAQRALAVFVSLGDSVGAADAHWLLAAVAADRGNMARFNAELELGMVDARRAGDAVRERLFDACMARFDALHDFNAAQERWGSRLDPDQPGLHLSVVTYIVEFCGFIAAQSGDFARAIGHFIKAQALALQTGQVRISMGAMTNIGNCFTSLNDHHTALEWMQRGLDTARSAAWVPRIGNALMQTGETLRLLGQLDAAKVMLDEALQKLAPLAGSRNYAICLNYLADLQLDSREYDQALATFRLLQQRADVLGHPDMQIDARRGQAHALAYLGQPDAALEAASQALAMANLHNDTSLQIGVLRVLADMHARHALPAPCGMTVGSPALHFLLQALEVARGMDGYIVPGDLFDALGREYARIGDYSQAYSISLQAITAREKTHSQEATNRAIAMQVRHQTENAQAEGEHHRQLAASEARRAEVLQQTGNTLERLSTVGQEITAHLDLEAVFQALNRHVHGLLDASAFAIYLMQEDGQTLRCVQCVEAGRIIATPDIRVDDTNAYTARCARERAEVIINLSPNERFVNLIPGTLQCLSKLFAPLMVGERVLGVMTIQTPAAHAYAERERLIFRTLSAYGAIALDNARAYQQLQEAQTQLVAREKLAALGSLVAGVAHELNTPIGNCLMMAGSLQEQTDQMDQKMQQQSLNLVDMKQYLQDARDSAHLIMRGLTSAADLVNSFKQVAVDRTTAQRRSFDLQQTSHEIVATMMNQIRPRGHTIALDIPENINMVSYPGPFGQVLANFINNAMLHAFDGKAGGHMVLSARQDVVGRVRVQFADNGVGIGSANLERIFEPFFTTKMGQGGSGLGLSISYNIVTSLLQGKISAESETGKGTVFTLDLPLETPPAAMP